MLDVIGLCQLSVLAQPCSSVHQLLQSHKDCHLAVQWWWILPQVISLTFDDGPQAASLTTVLDVLKSESVPGTFFVNTYPEGGWGGAFNSPANQVCLVLFQYLI